MNETTSTSNRTRHAPLLLTGLLALASWVGVLDCDVLKAADEIAFEVYETAGIRRFGYPVAATLHLRDDVSEKAGFLLVSDGRPVPAQFTRLPELESDKPCRHVAVDFTLSCAPYERRRYVLRYGDDVKTTTAPTNAMKIVAEGDVLRVIHGPKLEFHVPASLAGLLAAVKSPSGDWLQEKSGGLYVKTKGGKPLWLGRDVPMARAEILREGTHACALRFTQAARHPDLPEVNLVVRLEFPRSKSWMRVDLEIDDERRVVDEAGVELHLRLGGQPALVDFGAGSLVYTTLKSDELAALESPGSKASEEGSRPRWQVTRGKSDALEPLVVGPDREAAHAEGWAHLMDQARSTAVAVDRFGWQDADVILTGGDGRLILRRVFGGSGQGTTATVLTAWYHFVSSPVQIGALTSPQSMQRPLHVRQLQLREE